MASNRPKRMKHPNVVGSSSQSEPAPGRRRTQRSSSSNFDMDRFNALCGTRRVIRSQTLGDDIPQLGLKELFVYQGWEPLTSCTHVTFPNLVKAFYFSAVFSHATERFVEANLFGTTISLTLSQLNQFLGVPSDGDIYFATHSWEHTELNHNTVSTYLFGTNIPGRAMNLKTLQMRALHKYLCHSILPSAGHFDEVNFMHQYLLYMLLNHRKVNFGFIMMSYMGTTQINKRRTFPYGDYLSKIFLDHFSIQPPSDDRLLHTPNHIFNKRHITLMGFKWSERTNEWVPRSGAQSQPHEGMFDDEEVEAEEGDEGGDQEMDEPQHVGEGSSSFNIQDELAQIRAQQVQHGQELAYLRGTVDAHSMSLGRIESSMDQMMEWMRAMRFQPPPPPDA
jgi:hypothetical protein